MEIAEDWLERFECLSDEFPDNIESRFDRLFKEERHDRHEDIATIGVDVDFVDLVDLGCSASDAYEA
jgi:hypothetical protein